MKNGDLAKYVRLAVYNTIGETMAKFTRYYGVVFETQETIAALDFINFAKLHDFRIAAFNKIDNPDEEKTIKFNGSDEEKKTINYKLDKRVGRIDFKSIEKAGVTIEDLLEIIYLDPEVNAMFQKYINEPEKYVFSKASISTKGKPEIGYYSNDKSRSFEISCLARADEDGKLLQIGNRGRILAQLLFEWGKNLNVHGYREVKPVNKEEKAAYEVKLMSSYYSRLDK